MRKNSKFNHPQFSTRRRLLPVLIGQLLAAGALGGAQAATINVAANAVYINNNGVCSLIEAINNAQGSSNADCAAGDPFGPDTLNLAPGSTYLLTVLQNTTDGNNGLPSINSSVTINGNNATIERDDLSVDAFRIFHVGATGNLTLNNLTLRDGLISGSGGAVLNRGVLTATNSTFSSNTASSRGGAILNYGAGIVSLINSTFSDNLADGSGGALSKFRNHGNPHQ
jgi:predicted outer membrane repeat protein